ncbi:hypothetical protein BU15DRAFT_67665 [Melanogaster broomeanus]|nr:hypothetical protein BU15DRAFT_67665 [Melanogaster broomeanus]
MEQRNTIAKQYIAATIPDTLFTRIKHLGTAHECYQYLSSLFETKKSDATQREAICNPRTPAVTRQKPSERSCKAQDHETAAKKAESAEVEESRDGTRRECKRERDASSQGRVERRDRRESASLVKPTSSQNVDGRDVGTRRARDTPPKPQTASQTASEAAADAANPNATSAGPTGPAGAPPKPQREGQGQEANEGVEGEGKTSMGRPGEEIATARGPGEGAADQTADGISLAAPASSPNDDGGDENVNHTHVAPNETPPTASKPTPHDRTPHEKRSSGEGQGVAGRDADARDHRTPEHAARGEQDSQVTSGDTGAHGKGAEPSDGTQTQRQTNGTRAGQRHGANAHGEGHSARAERPSSVHEQNGCMTSSNAQPPDGILKDPGGRVKPNTLDRPPSKLLEGERGDQKHTSSTRTGQHHSTSVHGIGHGARAKRHRQAHSEGTMCERRDKREVEQEVHEKRREELIEGEEGRMRERTRSTMKTNEDDQRNPNVNDDLPRAPPEPPPPTLNHPERSRDEAVKSDEQSSPQTTTDAHHEPSSEVAALGDRGSEREPPASEGNGRDIETNAPSRDTRPRACMRIEEEARDDEGCRKGQGEGDGCQRDNGASGNDGTTSDASRDSRRVVLKALAEDEQSQHHENVRTTPKNSPAPSRPSAKRRKRPTEPVNPPRRRGRLKTQPARIHRARAYAGTRTRAVYGHIGTIPAQSNSSDASDMHRECRGSVPGQPGPKPKDHECSTRGPRTPIARKRETHRELPYRVTAQTQRFEPRRTQSFTDEGTTLNYPTPIEGECWNTIVRHASRSIAPSVTYQYTEYSTELYRPFIDSYILPRRRSLHGVTMMASIEYSKHGDLILMVQRPCKRGVVNLTTLALEYFEDIAPAVTEIAQSNAACQRSSNAYLITRSSKEMGGLSLELKIQHAGERLNAMITGALEGDRGVPRRTLQSYASIRAVYDICETVRDLHAEEHHDGAVGLRFQPSSLVKSAGERGLAMPGVTGKGSGTGTE